MRSLTTLCMFLSLVLSAGQFAQWPAFQAAKPPYRIAPPEAQRERPQTWSHRDIGVRRP